MADHATGIAPRIVVGLTPIRNAQSHASSAERRHHPTLRRVVPYGRTLVFAAPVRRSGSSSQPFRRVDETVEADRRVAEAGHRTDDQQVSQGW